jgi:hypothetical protein
MSGFNVCTVHRRFHPCVSHVRGDCRWSNEEQDVWEVSGYIISTAKQELWDELIASIKAGEAS